MSEYNKNRMSSENCRDKNSVTQQKTDNSNKAEKNERNERNERNEKNEKSSYSGLKLQSRKQ